MSVEVTETSLNLIPAGYKQTEVGVIPEDWEVVTLGDIGQTVVGLTYSPDNVADFGTLVLRSSNVQNGKLAYADNVYVNMKLPERVIVKQGDILICVRNGSRQLIGKCALIDQNAEGNAFGAFMSIFRSKYSLFVFYQFQSNLIQNQINEIMGATINQITNKDMSGFKIVLPSNKKEQTAIANALSDADSLINELEKLIAKKQAIKTATMQQLLTGRTRLPQFALREDGTKKGTKKSELGEIPEDWEVVCFSECGYFQSGSGFPTKYQGKQEGDYPFFKVSDMNNVGNENNLINSNNYISETVRNLISAKLIPVNAIVFAKIGAAIFLERKKICFQTSCIDNNMMAYIVNDKKLYYKYAYLLFKNINLAQFVEATALPSLSGRDIGQKIVALPTSDEQTAIATILSDMDEDIQALEQRLSKTRQIKQGMMQELLTGKTRLIKPSKKVIHE
ncbi:restriction endonuclease subunit S [Providencia stuartii]|uniref:restriction endonuclease subunit S n=1 Tax=Morganellaceae TaxID=1903414 RepID=UPI0018C4DFE9|nr:restriction endonuclease subunit S [Proteus mirabilis]HCE8949118.1 restriction endonuclease subunit S [Morganella morganii]MBG2762899.1 restriction endonuclease subunit S [Proteus mirabilis]MBI6212239.1 restriction endonuclease subunit S [Proteus mirabilis]MBS3880396.1 restriction endonuclease subunit S [Proteus mirabilis]MCT0093060.1 restriction endonuclease subunit S [Proteus mirabilis]